MSMASYTEELTAHVFCQEEIVLCSGTFGSPQILMLSGIGPGSIVSNHNISVISDLPGTSLLLQFAECLTHSS